MHISLGFHVIKPPEYAVEDSLCVEGLVLLGFRRAVRATLVMLGFPSCYLGKGGDCRNYLTE